VDIIYPNYFSTYWNLRTLEDNPYTVDQALEFMVEQDETGEWASLDRYQVRQLEMRYMKQRHPSYRA
jgi:hypothetical protein